jgi:hypothetical protein
MKFTITHAYDKDTETVFKVLTDESYLIKKFEATGAKNIQILQCKQAGKEFVIHRQMDIAANPPDLLKKFLKVMNRVVAKDTWRSFDKELKTGVFEVDIKGVPISIAGTITLKPTGKGCEYIVDFDAKCSIPLIGGKLLSLVEKDTRANQKVDYEFTCKHLANL